MSNPPNRVEWCNLCHQYHGALDACIETEEQLNESIEAKVVGDFITLCLFILVVLAVLMVMSE